ncbi:hypothetical protein [Fodinibius halophilus]|uniref:Uncharacterized protein n=1 Tax=Fodinibius halophilus TaxID=1736908 RepID=A0A6M1TF07_9BACT|nr:hypothetical protein [Fodinibius halophilus]NGP87200.1 hypothetical protein [Fodinibius halophilus]
MRQLILTLSVFFLFSLAGNAMTSTSSYEAFTSSQESSVSNKVTNIVNFSEAEWKNGITSITIVSTKTECTVTIEGQIGFAGSHINVSVSATAGTCADARAEAFSEFEKA